MFMMDSEVVVIGVYLAQPGTKAALTYHAELGQTQLDALHDFVLEQKMRGREILLVGDMNAHTRDGVGWGGVDPSGVEISALSCSRNTGCCHEKYNVLGRGLLNLCSSSEMRILNGLVCEGFRGDPSHTRVSCGRNGPGDAAWGSGDSDTSGESEGAMGAVLDYAAASECVLNAMSNLQVGSWGRFSDHRPVVCEWIGMTPGQPLHYRTGDPQSEGGEVPPPGAGRVHGWRFRGEPSREQAAYMFRFIQQHQSLRELPRVLTDDGPDEAYRLLHALIREAWGGAGLDVRGWDGARSTRDGCAAKFERQLVGTWWDDEVAAALRTWTRLRKRKGQGDDDVARVRLARQRYRRLRREKRARWEARWVRFWLDITHTAPAEGWRVVKSFLAPGSLSESAQCLCSESEQRAHFRNVGLAKDNPRYDGEAASTAEGWVRSFLQHYQGELEGAITKKETRDAYWKLNSASPGIDGLTKAVLKPILTPLLPAFTTLFDHLYKFGLPLDEVALAAVLALKKKGSSLRDLDNFRGIHLLSFVAQWYASVLLARLQSATRNAVPIEQQGFTSWGRTGTASLAIYAVAEQQRLRGAQLYATFVDIRKAFPTVHRASLWRKLAKIGTPPQLLRAIMATYDNSRGAVIGPSGLGVPFEIELGTREGSVLSPWLYILYNNDLPAVLGSVELSSPALRLGDVELRVVMFADDVVFLAGTYEDAVRLMARWETYCATMQQTTSVPKTKVVVFTGPEDQSIKVVSGTLRAARREGSRLFQERPFTCDGEDCEVVASFVHLGNLLEDRETAEAAYWHRDTSGLTIWRVLKLSMRSVPFLPIQRVAELAQSLAGCNFLHGAEIWAPFIPERGSQFHHDVWAGILGLSTRSARRRLLGWLPLHDFDARALGAALRFLIDARGGPVLQREAARQLFHNFVSCPRGGRLTWLGRLRVKVRKVWPSFDFDPLRMTPCRGLPPLHSYCEKGHVVWVPHHRTFIERLSRLERQAAYRAILDQAPGDTQQGHVLLHCIRRLEAAAGLAHSFLFKYYPPAPWRKVQSLIRFYAGHGDFARVHAHYARRRLCPSLAQPSFRRACLFCLNADGRVSLDSEWHALLQCPHVTAGRVTYAFARFGHARLDYNLAASPEALADLLFHANSSPRALADLAGFVYDSTQARERELGAISLTGLEAKLQARGDDNAT